MTDLSKIDKQLQQARADLDVAIACLARASIVQDGSPSIEIRKHQHEQAKHYLDCAVKELRIAQHLHWPE